MRVNHWTRRWRRKPTIRHSSAAIALSAFYKEVDVYRKLVHKKLAEAFGIPEEWLK